MALSEDQRKEAGIVYDSTFCPALPVYSGYLSLMMFLIVVIKIKHILLFLFLSPFLIIRGIVLGVMDVYTIWILCY
jgi:hypothetical protein